MAHGRCRYRNVCWISGWTEPREKHTQAISRLTFSSRTRSHRTTVLCTHKSDPLRLLLPAPQTVPEVLFLPTSQALAPSVGSLPAYLKPTALEARWLHLPVPPAKPQKRWLTEQRYLDQPPFICTSPQTTQRKAPLCHPSTIFHKFL